MTAEKFWLDKYFGDSVSDKDKKLWLQCNNQAQNTVSIMIEFAKLHVEAALKQASEKATILENGKDIGNTYIWDAYNTCNKDIEYETNKDSILNAYPLTNIK